MHRPQGWRAATSLDGPEFLPSRDCRRHRAGKNTFVQDSVHKHCLSSAYKPKRAAGHTQAQLQYLELKKRHFSEPLWVTDRKAFLFKRSLPHKFCDLALYPWCRCWWMEIEVEQREMHFGINGSAWLLAVQKEKMRCIKNFFLVNLYFIHLHHSRETKLHRLSWLVSTLLLFKYCLLFF